MTVIYLYTHDSLQKAVKLETSLLAERRRVQFKDGTSEEMLDDLVMDEEYDVMFRKLFLEAHADVLSHISVNYLMDTPTDLSPMLNEFQDFSQDRDFTIWMNMHEDWPKQYRKSVDIKLQQYLTDYICYRWLETKSPNDALTFRSRLEPTIDDVKSLLIRKTVPLKRWPSFP